MLHRHGKADHVNARYSLDKFKCSQTKNSRLFNPITSTLIKLKKTHEALKVFISHKFLRVTKVCGGKVRNIVPNPHPYPEVRQNMAGIETQ